MLRQRQLASELSMTGADGIRQIFNVSCAKRDGMNAASNSKTTIFFFMKKLLYSQVFKIFSSAMTSD